MNEPERFVLTQSDKDSTVWRKLKHHLQDFLQQRRESNDNSYDGLTTAHLRGEIMILKYLLALDDDKQPRTRL